MKLFSCLLFYLITRIIDECNGEVNNTKKCEEGWQGKDCEFCAGKIRLTEPSGFIHDGLGNYSIGVKCSWLIDARGPYLSGNSSTNSVKKKPKRIRLHLEEFATECSWDHLYIYDGDSVQSPLLAVFSGLMYKSNFSIRRIPEVVAHSGATLLHFFSDDAYNMSGFNISYRFDSCPTTDSSLICSGHGVCIDDGICTCDAAYMGAACHIPKCPNNCSYPNGHCDREKHRCNCTKEYAGSDCKQKASHGYWETIDTDLKLFSPPGRASHGSAVYGDTLFIIGGESYEPSELLYAYDFNGNVWEAMHVEKNNSPAMRYGASTVIYGDKIFMYGGVIKGIGVTNELWAYDVSARNWENITVKTELCNSTSTNMCPLPLESAGHSANIVPIHDGAKTQYYMIVIFGHSPIYGFLNTVQEYNLGTREWRIITTNGFPVKGGYGHSSSYDELTEKIYVYGGIISESESQQLLSNKLYSYDPKTHSWTMLTSSSTARYLHTANFISDGLMMVFGGNTHNDTSHSFGAKCYSMDLLLYDVICDSWHHHSMPNDLQADLARFGHTSQVFETKLYVYGGFDGQMLSDLLRFTPGTCAAFDRVDLCLNSRPGVKCIWDHQESKCKATSEIQKTLLFQRGDEYIQKCIKRSRMEMTQQHIAKEQNCADQHSCHACVSTSSSCGYCNNPNTRRGSCVLEKCSDPSGVKQRSQISLNPIRQLDKCPKETEPLCAQLHNCQACISNSVCFWSVEHNKCMFLGNRSNEETLPCPPSCSSLNSCVNCTQEDCIWCQNEERCVDKNAYTASFPYGQCREWTTYAAKCRAATTGVSQCSFYKTCSQCRDDPACGWCDDGSQTGLGKCLDGGDSGPLEQMDCPANHWHFTHCPSCQCNGHSTCEDGSTCGKCVGDVIGANCEKCRSGFWGNPVNGGACKPCECNNQASTCHSDMGKCFCSTKGLAGDHCEKCDATNHYHGDPKQGSCYYDLTIDYQFTFNLSKKEDRHYTQINFRNSPVKADIDADFTITCSVSAKMNITIKVLGQEKERPLFTNINCTTFRQRFSKADHQFGYENNQTITTFYVYVYDFQPPLWIQIAFSQYPKLNLQQFFVTFSTCFLLLLCMAAILWKIKQKYDMFRRRQRLFVEMEQMASRPFSQVLVEIDGNREYNEINTTTTTATKTENNVNSNNIINTTNATKKRKKDSPSPIALEPCAGNKAAVLSLLVRMPTGGATAYSPPGQSAGLAVASALVTLGNPRRPSIELNNPKDTNKSNKRKQSQHPDSL